MTEWLNIYLELSWCLWVCHLTCWCVTMSVFWGLRYSGSGLVYHFGCELVLISLCHVLGLCHSSKCCFPPTTSLPKLVTLNNGMGQTALSVQISQNRPQNLPYLKMSRIFLLYYKWLSAVALMVKETLWRDPTLLKPQLRRISKIEKGCRSPNQILSFFRESNTKSEKEN